VTAAVPPGSGNDTGQAAHTAARVTNQAEVAYEDWIAERDPADAGSMAGFVAGFRAAVAASGGWPLCPNGCGCRLGSEDAEAADCACDGLCCYDEIEVSEVFAERDRLRKALAAREPQADGVAEVVGALREALGEDPDAEPETGEEPAKHAVRLAHYLKERIDELHGLVAQPAPGLAVAPELREAMAETRQLRTAMRTLAGLWDAASDKDEETAQRPNRARLVLEERATTRRNCAADIRKLAGPEDQ